MDKVIPVGSKVRFTSKFLKSTGQYAGKESRKHWKVVDCVCDLCSKRGHIAVNEEHSAEYMASLWTAEEIANHPSLKYRHIHTGNLEVCK